MSSGPSKPLDSKTAELLARLLKEQDLDALIASFADGKIDADRVVKELSARYQRDIGSAALALAEHDKSAAQRLAERLRSRVEELVSLLGMRDTPTAAGAPIANVRAAFKDRDDQVLLREYVILHALAGKNLAVRSSALFALVREIFAEVSEATITAQLSRLAAAGVIGKEGKGRYLPTAQSAQHLAGLVAEIEARGMTLPPTSGVVIG